MKRKSKVKKEKEYKPDFITYMSSAGHEIFVGRNNLQNDALTFKIDKKDDYWSHAKGMPGSHVIIKTNGDELTDDEYVEAAQILHTTVKGKTQAQLRLTIQKK